LAGAALPGEPAWLAQLRLFASPVPAPSRPPPEPAWGASAPGRGEPGSGGGRLAAVVVGRLAAGPGRVHDRGRARRPLVLGDDGAGDLLVRIEDEEAGARLAAAEAQAALRKRERDAVGARGAMADLRKSEDGAADAERALAAARQRHDRVVTGRGAPSALADARKAVAEALGRLDAARADLARRKAASATAPAPRDAALTNARADLPIAEALFEKTRVRAPFAGTILQVPVHVGEVVARSRDRPLAVLADLSRLRVRADLDERNRGQVFVGQAVLVRSESFADTAKGKVASIAP